MSFVKENNNNVCLSLFFVPEGMGIRDSINAPTTQDQSKMMTNKQREDLIICIWNGAVLRL